jgi:hypothetical protein
MKVNTFGEIDKLHNEKDLATVNINNLIIL